MFRLKRHLVVRMFHLKRVFDTIMMKRYALSLLSISIYRFLNSRLTCVHLYHRCDGRLYRLHLRWICKSHECNGYCKLCPVRSFEKYLSLLNPNCKYFWQRRKPVEKVMDYSTVWYDNVPVSRNSGQILVRFTW